MGSWAGLGLASLGGFLPQGAGADPQKAASDWALELLAWKCSAPFEGKLTRQAHGPGLLAGELFTTTPQ